MITLVMSNCSTAPGPHPPVSSDSFSNFRQSHVLLEVTSYMCVSTCAFVHHVEIDRTDSALSVPLSFAHLEVHHPPTYESYSTPFYSHLRANQHLGHFCCSTRLPSFCYCSWCNCFLVCCSCSFLHSWLLRSASLYQWLCRSFH